MPFGPYDDFDDCVAKNADKTNAEGYCAAVEAVAKGAAMRRVRMAITPVTMADDDGDGIDDITGDLIETVEMEEPMIESDGDDFHTMMVLEGVWTGDGRWIEEGALTWRDLPLPLMGTDRTTEGHMDAILIGTFTRIERQGLELHGWGRFVDSDDPTVMRLQDLIRNGDLRGISVDLDAMEYEIVVPRMIDIDDMPDIDDESEDDEVEVEVEADGDMDGDVYPGEDIKMRVTAARVMGATAVPFPAFAEAYIEGTASLVAALMTEHRATGGFTAMLATYADIDFAPPQGAREEAERGLGWRDEHGRGGTQIGVARARDIANGRNLSPDTIGRMVSYFARHEVDKQGTGWSPGEDGFPSAGRIAWALWGGDPGRTWAEKVQSQMKARDASGSITAAATLAVAPLVPPAVWFTNPRFAAPSPIRVHDDGRVTGHVAVWGSCHIGFSEQCVTPPSSATSYAHFLTGEVLCEDGSRHPVGQVTLGTGHAPLNANAARAAIHYDHTGSAVADVTAGEDEHGIWISGALRPGVAPEQVRTLMASDVSGDWRRVGAGLELVAVLAVNVPGFGKVRVGMNDGLIASLVASTPVPDVDLSRLRTRIAASIGRTPEQRRAELVERVTKVKEG
jgi:hypothetical protein